MPLDAKHNQHPLVAFKQSSSFLMSPSIRVKLVSFKSCSKFSLLPVAKLSRQTTLFPFSSKASHKFDPIKPAPPVTKNCFIT